MLTPEQIAAYNTRVSHTNINKLSADEQTQAINTGTDAQILLDNGSLALFINSVKFDIIEELGTMSSHTEEINNKRIALANELAGIERFVDSLRYAVNFKERLVTLQKGSVSPNR